MCLCVCVSEDGETGTNSQSNNNNTEKKTVVWLHGSLQSAQVQMSSVPYHLRNTFYHILLSQLQQKSNNVIVATAMNTDT